MSGVRPVHDSHVAGAYPHKREKMRPYAGVSQRHLRRKAETELRKMLKAAKAANSTRSENPT